MTRLHARDAKKYSILGLCAQFGKSKQAYFKYDSDASMARVAKEDIVVQYVRDVREKDPGIGGLKLWHMYQNRFREESPVGRDRFMDIIDANQLKIRRKMRKPRTTDSSHGLPLFPNLIKDIIPDAPCQIWVSDITYITLWQPDGSYKFCYLSLILDSYTEEIVGWSVGPNLGTAHPLAALRMAIRKAGHKPLTGLIHHSDRGCQYASREYVASLQSHGIRISMTENGDPKENAQAERINNTMKNELMRGVRFEDIESVTEYVTVPWSFTTKRGPT